MTQITAQDGVFANTALFLGQDDTLLVNLGTSVIVQNGPVVAIGSSGAHLLDIRGILMGQTGIWAPASEVPGSVKIVIRAGAAVMADMQSVMAGDAIYLSSPNSVVENGGAIVGIYGIVLEAAPGGATQINNRGLIQAGAYALFRVDGFSGDNVTITNSGTILSAGAALGFQGAGGNVRLVNTGLIEGDIYFGQGNDFYDGRKGRVISSTPGILVTIAGGLGENTYRPSLSAERMDGSLSAEDKLDFRFGPAVRLALDGSLAGTGAARGDVYIGIDEVIGSRRNDWLRGDNARNTLWGSSGKDKLEGRGEDDYLYGGAGNDVLAGDDGYDQIYGDAGHDKILGGAGNDFLFGGVGHDRLFGGAGDDQFLYVRPQDGGDFIADFRNVAGNDDSLAFLASGFGLQFGGDARNATADEFLLTRGHHRAKDRGDRFIFDTASTTLWFDADGTGQKKAVLIADFAAGVRLSFSDILISNG